MPRSTASSSTSATTSGSNSMLSTPKLTKRSSSIGSAGHSTPPSISSPSRPSFPTISLRTSPAKSSHSGVGESPSQSISSTKKTARSSLLNVLSRPRITSQVSNTTVSAEGPLLTPEDEFSDQSTVSSYASSFGSSYTGSVESASENGSESSSEEMARVYKDYLEKPFVNVKQVIKHSEFGHDNNPNWRWTSQYNPDEPIHTGGEETPSYFVLISTYLSYLIMIVLGHMRDFLGKQFYPASYAHLMPQNGYAALNSDFDSFYTRRLKQRMDTVFARPVTGVAGRTIMCLDRKSDDHNLTFKLTGGQTRALNVSSYNYLGFASSSGGCADAAEAAIKRYGVSSGGARHDASTLDLHVQTEKLVARFLGVESAMVGSMGYATNSTTIPALVGKGCLVISDEFNHASIRFGTRLSGAHVRTFKHNDMGALEKLLKEVISQGQSKTHRPWKKIMVIVEGLYSMEGSLVDLPVLMELKQRYKFYLYVDEAHSVGAIGPNGRGVCDYFGIDPREIDILMGTFTKSFGASGGYVAGSKQLVDRLRLRSHGMTYSDSMSPPVLAQILASMGSIMGIAPPLAPPPSEEKLDSASIVSRPTAYGPAAASSLPTWLNLPPALLNGTEGRERLRRLAFNSRYLASGLRKLGFIMYGHRDSPIIPLLIFQPGKMHFFSQMMMDRVGHDKTPIVVVVVAYPATPLIESRVRFCLSASHTKNDIDLLLRACDEVGDILSLKHGKQTMSVEQVIAAAEELVAMSF